MRLVVSSVCALGCQILQFVTVISQQSTNVSIGYSYNAPGIIHYYDNETVYCSLTQCTANILRDIRAHTKGLIDKEPKECTDMATNPMAYLYYRK